MRIKDEYKVNLTKQLADVPREVLIDTIAFLQLKQRVDRAHLDWLDKLANYERDGEDEQKELADEAYEFMQQEEESFSNKRIR